MTLKDLLDIPKSFRGHEEEVDGGQRQKIEKKHYERLNLSRGNFTTAGDCDCGDCDCTDGGDCGGYCIDCD